MLVASIFFVVFAVAAVWFLYQGRDAFRKNSDLRFALLALGGTISGVSCAVAVIAILGQFFGDGN